MINVLKSNIRLTFVRYFRSTDSIDVVSSRERLKEENVSTSPQFWLSLPLLQQKVSRLEVAPRNSRLSALRLRVAAAEAGTTYSVNTPHHNSLLCSRTCIIQAKSLTQQYLYSKHSSTTGEIV